MDAIDARSLQALLTALPFRPFRISTTRTGVCDIESPAGVLLSVSALYVGREPNADGIPTQVRQIPVAQIARVEVL